MSTVIGAQDANNLARYVTGAYVADSGEFGNIVFGTAALGGISGAVWGWQNRHDLRGGFTRLGQDAAMQRQIVNSANIFGPNTKLGGLKNKWYGATEYVSKTQLDNILTKIAANPNADKSIANYIGTMLGKGASYSQVLNSANRMQAVANVHAFDAKVASQMANGSVVRGIKNTLGVTKLTRSMKVLEATSPTARTLLKGVRGNAAFAAIAFGLGVVTDVVPAFQIGTKEGFKQLGKTTAKTGLEVGGWAAGMALGGKIGAVAGTAIGGPIGTVVGGAIGLICGLAGSLLGGKISDWIFGESEVKIAQKKMAKELAQAAEQNSEGLDELATASYQTLLTNAVNGTLSESDKEIKKTLEKITGEKINLIEEAAAYKKYLKEVESQTT